jgi:hypothetical protein
MWASVFPRIALALAVLVLATLGFGNNRVSAAL